MGKGIRLSQCMIVKDEEKNIRRALTWGKDIVCEQIVIDTGSTDRTVEIAKEMGATVYHFEWINDFAAAKNFALEHASGNWIAFLDADEYFSETDVKRIIPMLKQAEEGILYKGRKRRIGTLQCAVYELDADGKVKGIDSQIRIFRNIPQIRFEGKIHERIVYRNNLTDYINADVCEEIGFYHTGYAWTEDFRKKKMKRNITALRNEYEKNPSDSLTQLYLAESLIIDEQLEEGIKFALKATKNEDGRLPKNRLLVAYQIVLYHFANTMDERIHEYYQEAEKIDEHYPDIYIAMGFYYSNISNHQKAIVLLEKGIKYLAEEPERQGMMALENLGSAYERLIIHYNALNQKEKAFSYKVLMLELNPHRTDVVDSLVRQLVYEDTATSLEIMQFLQKFYDFTNQKEIVFLIRMAVRIGASELMEQFKEYLTEENYETIFREKRR